ncbi:pilus assembly PilX family protein [Desulfogranum japonicum]|uniref:pilus assembly PilX family protein n=1 Tax=Desulfogranum japonicum TaxID=231447 RepID=UPI00041CA7B4|nr:pilus assembly PilX N-terminal domain-containing protein [Desulfogranum japonicum]
MDNRGKKNQERGFVLVTCLIIMLVLSLIGIMATQTSIMELRSSANDRIAKSAFYRADSGIYAAPKPIREVIVSRSTINIQNVQMIDPDTNASEVGNDFYKKIAKQFDKSSGRDPSTTITFQQSTETTSVNILPLGSKLLEGESAEYGDLYGGGSGPKSFALLYLLNSTGTAPGNGEANIEAVYKYIPRPGGL